MQIIYEYIVMSNNNEIDEIMKIIKEIDTKVTKLINEINTCNNVYTKNQNKYTDKILEFNELKREFIKINDSYYSSNIINDKIDYEIEKLKNKIEHLKPIFDLCKKVNVDYNNIINKTLNNDEELNKLVTDNVKSVNDILKVYNEKKKRDDEFNEILEILNNNGYNNANYNNLKHTKIDDLKNKTNKYFNELIEQKKYLKKSKIELELILKQIGEYIDIIKTKSTTNAGSAVM
jgi:chromosome segregation ATPase